MSFDINELRTSDKPQDKMMLEIIDSIKEIKSEIQEIKNYNKTQSKNFGKTDLNLIDVSTILGLQDIGKNQKITNIRIPNVD